MKVFIFEDVFKRRFAFNKKRDELHDSGIHHVVHLTDRKIFYNDNTELYMTKYQATEGIRGLSDVEIECVDFLPDRQLWDEIQLRNLRRNNHGK